jgi:tetratricopeptide (TPR) repeat protein
MLYELEMELHNEGLDDLRLMAQRAELCRWVYTQFSGECELNLANFRASEAESLWEIGKKDIAEARFQEVIKLYPKIAVGYIEWADCYYVSDWSYQYGADFEKAESIYRQALGIEGIDDRVALEDNLEGLLHDKEHPEKRERIKQGRLKRIQSRKNL